MPRNFQPIKLGKNIFMPRNKADIRRFLDLVDDLKKTNGEIHIPSLKHSSKKVPINSVQGRDIVSQAEALIVYGLPYDTVMKVYNEPLETASQPAEEEIPAGKPKEEASPAKPVSQKGQGFRTKVIRETASTGA